MVEVDGDIKELSHSNLVYLDFTHSGTIFSLNLRRPFLSLLTFTQFYCVLSARMYTIADQHKYGPVVNILHRNVSK